MKGWKRIPLLILLLQAGGVGALEGQGALLDWIHKMSGRGFVRAGLQYTVDIESETGLHGVSIAAMYGFKVRDADDEVDGDGNMQTLQVAVETPIIGSGREGWTLLGVLGLAGHRFARGDGAGSFVTGSFPAQALIRYRFGNGGAIQVGTGFNIFWFPDDAAPVTGETAGFEAAWGLTFGVDLGLF